jgi:hypothetical protein
METKLNPGEVVGNDGAIYEALRKWIPLSKYLRVSPDGTEAQFFNSRWERLEDGWGFDYELSIYRGGYAEGRNASDDK